MAVETKFSIISKIITELRDNGKLDAAIATINAQIGGPVLPSPQFYHFGDRVLEKKLKRGQWVLCVLYDNTTTAQDERRFRLEDWAFALVGVMHEGKQVLLNKKIIKAEEALILAVDTELTQQFPFQFDVETVKDIEKTDSGLSTLDYVGNSYFMECSLSLRIRTAVCR